MRTDPGEYVDSGEGTGLLSRRSFIASAAAVVVGPVVLTGCGGGSSSGAVESRAATAVRRGGTLRVACAVGGSSDTLDPNAAVSDDDVARANNIFERLAVVAPDGSVENVLADSFEHSGDATEWTIRLRSDVTWQDGTPLTADDLMFTLNRIGAPNSTLVGASIVSAFDLKRMRRLDPLTVRLPLHLPIAELPELFVAYYMAIVKNGQTRFTKPIGTGPFVLSSYQAGVDALLVRNPHYWMAGRPYVDDLQISIVTDPTARLNGLLAGQFDAIEQLDFAQAKAQAAGGQIKLLEAPNGSAVPLTMAVDTPPFDDVRVRQALRLIAGRPQIIQSAQDGYGSVGNDLFGKGESDYDSSLPQRTQDIEMAKALLKAAGKEGLTITLDASDIAGGALESATVFEQQAVAAGVRVAVNNLPASSYYGTEYLKYPFGQSDWPAQPLSVWFNQTVLSGAPYNETHWRRPDFDKLFYQAQGTIDAAKRQTLYDDLQTELWNEGGYIFWGFAPYLDGLSNQVHGAVANPASPLSNWSFRDYWLG